MTSHFRRQASRLLIWLSVSLAMAATGCQDQPPTMTGPDTVPPRLQIVFPVSSDPNYPATFDRDSNGLMDLELRWSDSLGRVNATSVRIVARGGVPGAAVDSNLALGWRRVRLDSAGAAFEETVPLLLRGGLTTLVTSLADSAGNVVTESVTVALPPASFHRVISLNYQPQWNQVRGVQLVLLPDGSKGAVPFTYGRIAIFDPDGNFATRYVEGITQAGLEISVDPQTGLTYLGGGYGTTTGITVFDLGTESAVGHADVGLGVESVFVHGQRIYAGEACTTGRIIVLDKTTLAEVGRIEPNYFVPSVPCNRSVVRSFSSNGAVGWATTVNNRGVMSFDTQSFAVLQHLDVRPPAGDGDFGYARDIQLVADRYLYVARYAEGLDEIDLALGSSIHYSGSGNSPIAALAVAPDGHRLFVSALASATGPSDRAPRLFTIPGLQLQWAFPVRPGRISDAAVWHPDGKRVYVMAEFDVDVYIVRPQ
jgi:hypothetical protein